MKVDFKQFLTFNLCNKSKADSKLLISQKLTNSKVGRMYIFEQFFLLSF